MDGMTDIRPFLECLAAARGGHSATSIHRGVGADGWSVGQLRIAGDVEPRLQPAQ